MTLTGGLVGRFLGSQVEPYSEEPLWPFQCLQPPHPPYTNSTQAVGGCGTRIRFFLQRKPSSCILFLELLCATEFLFSV